MKLLFKQRFFSWLDSYDIFDERGETMFTVEGSFMEWDYSVIDGSGRQIAQVSKEIFNLTDTYSIEVFDSANALYALMLVLAIDAEKCSRG